MNTGEGDVSLPAGWSGDLWGAESKEVLEAA